MSTFDGTVQEIPDISLDCFEEANLSSYVYFISHCHTDHLKGFNSWEFQQRLIGNDEIFVYGSELTILILQRRLPRLARKLKGLPIDSPSIVQLPNGFVTVTLIPAGHCPGSVMFLFETDKRILCTGDYNVKCSDLRKMKSFYCHGQIKHIDTIYLDTTFFSNEYQWFPSRKDSLRDICRAIQDWITQSKKHMVQIQLSAYYGYEYLFIGIYKTLKMPIHVDEEKFNLYSFIPEMDGVTTRQENTQIHCSCANGYNRLCGYFAHLKIIRPCALSWSNFNQNDDLINVHSNGVHKLCFPTHASYDETKQLLLFLKPDNVIPCVVSDINKRTIEDDLTAITSQYQNQDNEESIEELVQPVSLVKKDSPITPNAIVQREELLSSPDLIFKRRRL